MFDESVDVAAVDPLPYRLKHNELQQLKKTLLCTKFDVCQRAVKFANEES